MRHVGGIGPSIAAATLVMGCAVHNAECIDSKECLGPEAWAVPGCTPTETSDTPDLEGRDDDCDGIDGSASRSVFVALGGDDEASGSRVSPVRTLARGIALARERGLEAVLVAEGVYDEAVTLEDGISLYGGYVDEGEGAWSRRGLTVIAPQGTAVIAEGIEAHTVVGRMALAPRAEAPGESAIGLHAIESAGLVLEGVIVAPGPGAPGADGATPEAPAAAADGERGMDADWTAVDCPATSIPYTARGGAGGGAGEPCAGGRGGDGGGPPVDDPFPNLTFGGAGERFDCEGDPVYPMAAAGTRSVDGGLAAAGDGPPGAGGVPGAAGDPAGSTVFEAGGIQGGRGDDGADGGAGQGGAGGGGAARQGSVVGSGAPFLYCHVSGGGGGGGGQGGFGGAGGMGGSAGGASIGVLLWSSAVALRSVRIVPNHGGDGGAGAPGAEGGLGGLGGLGGAGFLPEGRIVFMVYLDGEGGITTDSSLPVVSLAYGGDGGPGGPGGPGGRGGGGAGGASVGILANASSTLDFDAVVIDPIAAVAGRGGGGPTHALRGADGIAGDVLWLPAEGGPLELAVASP